MAVDEARRLAALHRAGLLDTPPSESFDRITRLACETLDVPIALVSLVDEARQWFKSRIGIEATQTSRDASFCTHAVYSRQLLNVPDATRDPRFAGNPMVTGAPHIRAYIGVPIFSRDGHGLGTLCAIDTRPRSFFERHLTTLRDLAKIVEETIHARELAVSAETERRLLTIADTVPANIGYWNRDLVCEFANEQYRTLLGISPAQIIGMSMKTLLGESLYETVEPHARLALAGQAQRFERSMTTVDGRDVVVEMRYIPDYRDSSTVRGFVVLASDVTESRRAAVALEVTNAQLLEDAAGDPVTGICNRQVFMDRMDATASHFPQSGQAYGLVLIDIDDFHLINDRHGHLAGDRVLRAVGQLLKSQLRSYRDVAARVGSDEFALLLFGEIDEEILGLVAERLRLQISALRVKGSDVKVALCASIGLTMQNLADARWTTTYSRATTALYDAKAGGKNRVNLARACDPGPNQAMSSRADDALRP